MAAKVGIQAVTEGRLRLAASPTAELGAAAMLAQKDAGLKAADFYVIAVEPGTASDVVGKALAAAAQGTPASGSTAKK